MRYQQTIKNEVKIKGIGLHSGKETTLYIYPNEVDKGIVFKRVDLQNKPEIEVSSRYLSHKLRCTSFIKSGVEIHTTEHFLACCYVLGLDNLLIKIDSAEMPGLDGSGIEYFNLLKSAGIIQQEKRINEIKIKEKIKVEDKDAFIEIIPHSYLEIEYELDYGVKFLQQKVRFKITPEIFEKEIAPARTFALKGEVEQLLKLGLGKGANLKNTLIIDEKTGKIIENTLRFPDEFARHKLLDLIGDLSIIHYPIKGFIKAYKSGHKLNSLMVKKIIQK